jgi:hypothetical protein
MRQKFMLSLNGQHQMEKFESFVQLGVLFTVPNHTYTYISHAENERDLTQNS